MSTVKKSLTLSLAMAAAAIACTFVLLIPNLAFGDAQIEDEAGSTTISMHRLYNPNSGEHFYTADDKESANLVSLGWNDEGVGWIAPKTSDNPVFRLYNANGGEHHYTSDLDEKQELVKLGWSDEGIGWYSADSNEKPVRREYNPNAFANNHNYTPDTAEHHSLISLGWNNEGIGWYGLYENVDEEFLAQLKAGLEARWGIVDDEANQGTDSKALREQYTNTELDYVSPFENANFEDATLKQIAKRYIEGLQEQGAALEMYDTDYKAYSQRWSSGYDQRARSLKELKEKYNFSVSNDYQTHWDKLMARAEELG